MDSTVQASGICISKEKNNGSCVAVLVYLQSQSVGLKKYTKKKRFKKSDQRSTTSQLFPISLTDNYITKLGVIL